jgi:tetratricopeptide (TPR) repeat protein
MSKISNALKDLMSSVSPKEDPNAALPSEEAIPEEPLTLTPADQEKPVVNDPFSGLKPKKRANSMAKAPGEFEVSPPPEISVEFEQTELESSDTGPASETEKDHDLETVAEIGESFEDAVVEGAVSVVRERVQEAVENAIREAIENAKATVDQVVIQAMDEAKEEAKVEGELEASRKERQQTSSGRESRPHAFVIMPFGKKKGVDGTVFDFNAIYQNLIKPALEEAGFEPFRADEETTSGDILTDMFQELLLADLAICDLSIDNANVFYELGIRHAFRKRGIVHIQSGRAYMPFDIFNVRTIPYHTNEEGLPDPIHQDKDIQAIARVCRDTWASDQDAIHSPVFNLLTGLNEPDRRDLRTPLATGFWQEYNEWRQRVTIAQRQKRLGDIMLLTEEISNPLIKEEAIGEAGRALKNMNRHELALQQYRQGLILNPKNVVFRREEALHLNRLGRVDEAIVRLENLLQDHPGDTESTAYLGRIYKDIWRDSWEYIEDPEKRIQEAYEANHWLVKSIHTYLKGYYADLNNTYPGINALTLSIILDHLTKYFKDDDDPDVAIIQNLLPQLHGTLQFSLEKLSLDEKADYWTLASLAELVIMTANNTRIVKRTYKKSLTAARKNIYNLQSSISTLQMLDKLQLRPEFVAAGVQVLRDEIRRIQKEEPEEEVAVEKQEQQTVFLFKGHQIDSKGMMIKRFPEEMEPEVHKRIGAALKKYQVSENDLAVTAGAASGGDIIFIETCIEKNMKVEVHLPKQEPDYIKENISPAGDAWVERYYNLRNHPNVTLRLQQDHIGKVKPGDNVNERNNRWALYSSLVQGIANVRLIALWDGQSGSYQDQDGRLVSHMVTEMRRLGGYVEHLNTSKFDYWQAGGKVGKALDKLAGL